MRKRLAIALAAGWAVACGAPRPRPPSGAVVLTVKGRVENGPFTFGREDLARLPRRKVRAFDPRTGRAVEFEGVSLAPLLFDEMALARGADTAAIRGAGGYLAAIPLSNLRQLRPVLADRAGGQRLAELRLVWPNLDWPGLESDPRVRFWWVDGVADVDVLDWDKSFGRALRLPAGAADAARLGSDEVVTWCFSCHRVHGVGGERGRDLTRAAEGASGAQPARRIAAHAAAESRALGAAPPPRGAPARIAAFLAAVQSAGPLPAAPEGKDAEPDEGEPDEPPHRGW